MDTKHWFFIAIYKFLEYTDDYDFVKNELFSAMTQIIDAFIDGTIYDIKMDSEDGLVSAGNKDVQLTWMDVKVDGQTITPRNGKAVEINALWYNALRIYSLIEEKFGKNSNEIKALARKVKNSYKKTFWNESKEYLYDYIKPDGTPDETFRPNQIYAVYLPFELLDSKEEKAITDAVFAKLYTSYGLRSLAPDDKAYEPFYHGDRVQRDKQYHQGTVWGFLIGPFISSYLKVNNYSIEAQLRASLMIEPFISHMNNEECLGSISEIFDGNMPHKPAGCFAQAWSVAEFNRNISQDLIGFHPELINKKIRLIPCLPAACKAVKAVLPFGKDWKFDIEIKRRASNFVCRIKWLVENKESLADISELSVNGTPIVPGTEYEIITSAKFRDNAKKAPLCKKFNTPEKWVTEGFEKQNLKSRSYSFLIFLTEF